MKKNIAVIFGGNSSEHEVSLKSATFIIKNIDLKNYNVYPVGITKQGEWFLYTGEFDDIKNGDWEKSLQKYKAFISPDKSVGGLIVLKGNETEIVKLDVVFPMLHGKNGEDGTMQGLLKLSGIPYVGCNTLSSAICMDKAITHSLLTAANIEQAKYLWFYADRYDAEPEKIKNKIEARLNFPIFVKPANAGSSVGVTKVHDMSEFDGAVKIAANEDIKIVVEEGIVGREVECAVFGNRDAVASPIGEIIMGAEFYDYNDKYIDNKSERVIPAELDSDIYEKIRETAVRAYKLLGCAGLSRVDFFVTEKNNIILNEINTIPGFTSISMYPALWMSTGLSGEELVEKLINSAFNRYE